MKVMRCVNVLKWNWRQLLCSVANYTHVYCLRFLLLWRRLNRLLTTFMIAFFFCVKYHCQFCCFHDANLSEVWSAEGLKIPCGLKWRLLVVESHNNVRCLYSGSWTMLVTVSTRLLAPVNSLIDAESNDCRPIIIQWLLYFFHEMTEHVSAEPHFILKIIWWLVFLWGINECELSVNAAISVSRDCKDQRSSHIFNIVFVRVGHLKLSRTVCLMLKSFQWK